MRIDRCMVEEEDRNGYVHKRIYYEMWWQGEYLGDADTFDDAWNAICAAKKVDG